MKTISKLLLFFLFIIPIGQLAAQGETAHWFFGYNSGMDFTQSYTATDAIINGIASQTLTGVPLFVNGPINTNEGCFAISDQDGNLLFSSDGQFVYNRHNTQMPHGTGLKGNPSSSQSGIVTPRPKHPDNYYIVTAPAAEDAGHGGLNYYEVDMKLDDYKGDLVTNPSGQIVEKALNFSGLYPVSYASENLAAVGHADGINFWLVQRVRAHFFVWLVTENGIESTPTHSIPTTFDTGSISGTAGYTKFSADGKFIANNCSKNILTVARFNNSTGMISDIHTRDITLTSEPQATVAGYGVQFSPNNKYVYYTYYYQGPLLRLPVSSIFADDNTQPERILDNVNNIQIGPDNRIYGTTSIAWQPGNGRNLFIILNPDDENIDKALMPNYFPVGTGSHLSMPTFTSSFFAINEINVLPKNPCPKTLLTFSVQIVTGTGVNRITRLEWDFGDGSPFVPETDMDKYNYIQQHSYEKKGIYNLRLIPYRVDGSAITDKIKTYPVKIASCRIPVNHNISVMEYE